MERLAEDGARADDYARRLSAVADELPVSLLEDINHRLGDWSLSGESMGADYVRHLVENAERFVRIKREV